jgi:hypothetical protein
MRIVGILVAVSGNGSTFKAKERDMKGPSKIALALGMFMLFGCKPTTDRVPQADQSAAPQAGSPGTSLVSTNDRATVLKRLSVELNELDAKMAELKVRAQKAGDQAKAEWESRRPQLEAQRKAAAQKLDELKETSKEVWDQTRAKTEAAFAELQKGFKEAWTKLKE